MTSATLNRTEIARNAFYGHNELLMEDLRNRDNYTWNGLEWNSNGMTLEQTIQMVEALTDEDIEMLEAVGIL